MDMCPECGEVVDEINGDDYILHNNAKYHYDCYVNVMEREGICEE